jgi:MoaA/NifB/PqqE/SkfB family radical SAM enzyme
MISTKGDYHVCCEHKTPADHVLNIKQSSADDWNSSEYLNEVRETFLKDQRHPGCQQCWQREDSGFSSMRQRTYDEYQILGINVSKPKIKNVEIDLENLCNLKCLMCNENSSSAILAENQRLKINKIEQRDINWSSLAFENLQKILDQGPHVINIRGGEPFYNKNLLKLVQNIPIDQARSTLLHITTNATIWNEKWQEALSKFRLVRIMCSIDAIQELYEYLRYSADWNSVSKNILTMNKLSNVKILVHCVVQNLNISHVGDLIHWCQDNGIYLEFESIITPSYLQIQNLPESQKKYAISYLSNLCLKKYPDHIATFIDSSLSLLNDSKFDPTLWKEFVSQISMRDHIRDNDYRQFIKE